MLYGMARWKRKRARAEQRPPLSRSISQREREPRRLPEPSVEPPASTPLVVVRHATRVERLCYTRTQAAQALGISPTTFTRRILPYIETIDTPSGTILVPVEELERLLAERRRPSRATRPARPRGRRSRLPTDVVDRIQAEHADGRTLAATARGLNADGVPTAQGGRQWWPSTVRSVLVRSGASTSGRTSHSVTTPSARPPATPLQAGR